MSAESLSNADGTENLSVMKGAERYRRHIAQLVSDALPPDGMVLDYGSGDGIQTQYVAVSKDRMMCIEASEVMLKKLATDGFTAANDLTGIQDASFAGAFSINCLEHVEEDLSALLDIWRVLRAGSPLLLFLPAFPLLYSAMDANVGHIRRYKRSEIIKKMEYAGFKVECCHYVDSLGFFLSLLYRLLPFRTGVPSSRSIEVFDRVVFPASVQLDAFLKHVVGKNLFVVGRKPA